MTEVDLIKQLDDSNFADTIGSGLTLVDFFAEWCGPCKMLAPILKELAVNMSGKVTVAKLDIDASQQTTSQFQVTSVPTLILFKDGQEVNRVVGLRDVDALQAMVNEAL